MEILFLPHVYLARNQNELLLVACESKVLCGKSFAGFPLASPGTKCGNYMSTRFLLGRSVERFS